METFKSNTVYFADHIPSGERWYILGISKDLKKVCAAGYPPSIGDMCDCNNFIEHGPLTEKEKAYRLEKFGDS